jgi:hypothetical protein
MQFAEPKFNIFELSFSKVLWQVTLMIHFATRRLRLKVAIVPIF